MMVVAGAVVAAAPSASAATAPMTATPNLCQVPVDRFTPVTPWPGQTVATGLRIGQHPTFDRVVVDLTQFAGSYQVRYVPRVIEDGSGATVPLRGTAFLELRMGAVGHDENGHSTIPVSNYVVKWPSFLQVKTTGDFEGQLQVGIGLRSKADFVVSPLTSPNRLVIDVARPGQHPWTTCASGAVKVFFQNLPNYQRGAQPDVTPVYRRVATPAVASGALHAMFRWPTPDETAAGLRLVNSDASTFDQLSIVNGVARLRLLWECSSGGSTFTIANEIMPTLKQFPNVKAVKIYDPSGQTETPGGSGDSIPFCLEP